MSGLFEFKARRQAEPVRGGGKDSPSPTGARSDFPGIDPDPAGPSPGVAPAAARRTVRISAERTDAHLVSVLDPASFEAEQYRALRHEVEHLHKRGDLTVVAVSSSVAGEGKTTTAINLAGTLAQAGELRVLLVDADMRLPSLEGYLGLKGSATPGLMDGIRKPDLTLDDLVLHCSPHNLAVLPAGRCAEIPYEALKSPRLGELLGEARRRYDYVVLDTPPLLPVPDSRVLSRWVDGFLLVVAARRTPRKLLEEALNLMDPAKVIGLVFNGDDLLLSGYYGDYGGYGGRSRTRRVAGRGRKP